MTVAETLFSSKIVRYRCAEGRPRVEVTTRGGEQFDMPDFELLFYDCGGPACEECPDVVTARTALALHMQVGLITSQGFASLDDAKDPTEYHLFDELPPVAQLHLTKQWYLRFLRAFVDLGNMLSSGVEPRPRCTAEEMALHILVAEAAEFVAAGGPELLVPGSTDHLPDDTDDYEFDSVLDELLEDDDVLMLFDTANDDLCEPGSRRARELCVTHLHPREWFIPFGV